MSSVACRHVNRQRTHSLARRACILLDTFAGKLRLNEQATAAEQCSGRADAALLHSAALKGSAHGDCMPAWAERRDCFKRC